MRDRGAADVGVRRIQQGAAQWIGACVLRTRAAQRGEHAGAGTRTLHQAGAQQRGIGQEHAHARDRDGLVPATQRVGLRGRLGHRVADQHGDGTGVLRVLGLRSNGADAQGDEGHLAIHGLAVQGIERFAAFTGTEGLFGHRHHFGRDGRGSQGRAVVGFTDAHRARDATGRGAAERGGRQAEGQH